MNQQPSNINKTTDCVFISYSHKDKASLETLQSFLKSSDQNARIVFWDDTRIRPGHKWQEEIEKALDSAKAAILLVSQNFLASDYIKNKEVFPLLNTAKDRGVAILWIAISSCLWESSPISTYQCLNNPSRPLDSLTPPQRKAEWVSISKKIMRTTITVDSEKIISNERPKRTVTNYMKKEMDQRLILLAGYLFVEKDGRELVLVRANVRLPVIKTISLEDTTVEQAINEALMDLFNDVGLTIEKLLEVGFFKPSYYQLYNIIRHSQSLQKVPCIFFKMGLNTTFTGTTALWRKKSYSWVPKAFVAETWRQSIYGEEDEEESQLPYIVDPYQIISEDRVSLELGRKILECVDLLVFQINKGEILFLLIKRHESGVAIGWEYPKGGLFYHEMFLEGALRELEEETHINANNLYYCASLETQTVNVQERKKFYDTLRVHGLTFYYTGDPNGIRLDPNHTEFGWFSIEKAKEMLWIPYGNEFFRRWEERQQDILYKVEVVDSAFDTQK